MILVPWGLGSAIGYLAAGAVDTRRLGLDVAFRPPWPASRWGWFRGAGTWPRRWAPVAVAVPAGLVGGPSLGLVTGAVVGPFMGLAVPASPGEESSAPETPEPSAEAGLP